MLSYYTVLNRYWVRVSTVGVAVDWSRECPRCRVRLQTILPGHGLGVSLHGVAILFSWVRQCVIDGAPVVIKAVKWKFVQNCIHFNAQRSCGWSCGSGALA